MKWIAMHRQEAGRRPQGLHESNSRGRRHTLAVPVGSRHATKVAGSAGAIIRSGADFDSIAVGWQTGWVSRWP